MSSRVLCSQLPVRTCRLTSAERLRSQPLRLQHIHRQTAEARLPRRVLHIANAKAAKNSSSQSEKDTKQKSQQQEPPSGARPAGTDPEILDSEELDFEEIYRDMTGDSDEEGEEQGEEGIMGFEEWMGEDRIPVTVITGFLGSGKTTLLNHLLTKAHGKRIAVIENEFGEIDIDSSLVQSKEFVEDSGQIMMLNNGCMCCTVKDDLVNMLSDLIDRRDQFDQIVIETTGLADPQPIIATLRMSPDLQEDLMLDGVITLVDAKHVEQHLNEKKQEGALNEAAEQIAYADRILLNKTDLVSAEQLNQVERRIKAINSLAQIKRVQKADVPVDYVLGIAGFDPSAVGKELERKEHGADGASDSHSHAEHSHEHTHAEHSSSSDHTHSHKHDHDHAHHDHSHEHGHSHTHDDAVSSVSIILDGNVDPEKVNGFLERILLNEAENLYRYKGILSVEGSNARSVFQGVHLDFSADFDREWRPDEKRQSRMVFIGKDLNKDYLRKGFEACRV